VALAYRGLSQDWLSLDRIAITRTGDFRLRRSTETA
jgi:hypothetical protein